MRILKLAREPAPEGKAERTGVFTSGIVSRVGARLIGLYLQRVEACRGEPGGGTEAAITRPAALIQMCDALSRNTPKLVGRGEALLAYCIAHGGASLWK